MVPLQKVYLIKEIKMYKRALYIVVLVALTACVVMESYILALVIGSGFLISKIVEKVSEYNNLSHRMTAYEKSMVKKQIYGMIFCTTVAILSFGAIIHETRFEQHDRTPAIEETAPTIEKLDEWSKLETPDEVEK